MASQELIDQTVEFWSAKYGREITREEARQLVENLLGFFECLVEEDRRLKSRASD